MRGLVYRGSSHSHFDVFHHEFRFINFCTLEVKCVFPPSIPKSQIFKAQHEWPRGPFSWSEERKLFVSVPFTWNLPSLRQELEHGSLQYDHVRVGGPAVALMPDFLVGIPGVEVGGGYPRRTATYSTPCYTIHYRMLLEMFVLRDWKGADRAGWTPLSGGLARPTDPGG